MQLALVAGLVALFQLTDSNSIQPVVVETEAGYVASTIESSRDGRKYQAFRGIPYAKPPTGKLRFAEAEPALPWKGIRQPMVEPICFQYEIFIIDENQRVFGEEDCLYLSVFTPRIGKQLLPVMVYIHEGGFVSGAGPLLHGAQYFMDKDVVLVIFNYRLGPLGFLTTEDGVIPSNLGLKDQVLALKWVRGNIKQFGGDPNRVTLFGESAGGASVHYHMMSPLSKGLFSKAIIQSGSATAPWASVPKGLAKERARKVGTYFNCSASNSHKILACLREVPPHDLAGVPGQFVEYFGTDPVVVFGPIIESPGPRALISTCPFDTPTSVPLITGITSSEGALKTSALLSHDITLLMDEFDTVLPTALMYKYTSANPAFVTEKLWEFYFSGSNSSTNLDSISDLFTDGYFLSGLERLIRNHQGPKYFYLFDHLGQFSIADRFSPIRITKGPVHVDDLIYLFSSFYLSPGINLSEEDKKISKQMINFWVNFAKVGEPTPPGSETIWHPIRTSENEYLRIGTRTVMESNLLRKRMKFWSNLSAHINPAKCRQPCRFGQCAKCRHCQQPHFPSCCKKH